MFNLKIYYYKVKVKKKGIQIKRFFKARDSALKEKGRASISPAFSSNKDGFCFLFKTFIVVLEPFLH
jgi:hypothetical protein